MWICKQRRKYRQFKKNSMDSGYGAMYWLESFVVTKCETVSQVWLYSLGDSASNWVTVTEDNASNWGSVTWRQCPTLGHIHLEIEPQSCLHSFGYSASNSVKIFGYSNSRWFTVTWIQWLKLSLSYSERAPKPVIINCQIELLLTSESLWDIVWKWNKMDFRLYPNLDHIARIHAISN